MNVISVGSQRRAVRRATRTRCHAVGERGFELLGELALDLSPRGMLVACEVPAALGEPVLVSVLAPGRNPIWLDAEAEVARIVHGQRRGDRGYCIGLRFKYFDRVSRMELLSRLAGMPPPIPQRRLRAERYRIAWGAELPAPRAEVVAQPMLRVSAARGPVPAGVFSGG
jgi:hypothetical protein